MTTTTNITIPVPSERVPEFYAMVSKWLSDDSEATSSSPTDGPSSPKAENTKAWGASDKDLATDLWRTFTPTARSIFSVLIDNPGKQFSSEALAAAAGLEGAYQLAGAISWPVKRCSAAGKDWLVHTYPRVGSGSDYWMRPDTASVFAIARDSV